MANLSYSRALPPLMEFRRGLEPDKRKSGSVRARLGNGCAASVRAFEWQAKRSPQAPPLPCRLRLARLVRTSDF